MDNVNKTLYIPLYGKALVSRKGILLRDAKAEQIWAAEGFPLKGKSRSKWLAYYMGMRSAVFDGWLVEKMQQFPDAVVLHLGCGMDSRVERIGIQGHLWFDVDFPEVIAQRRRYYREADNYTMLASDIRDPSWLSSIPKGRRAIVIMEGVSMYLPEADLRCLLDTLAGHFSEIQLLMDCYTTFAAKASKYKNPINDVGVTQVYGIDDPRTLEGGMVFLQEHSMTPEELIGQLQGMERTVFRKLYAGAVAKKLYRMYEYHRK